jgi:hypothetical protein
MQEAGHDADSFLRRTGPISKSTITAGEALRRPSHAASDFAFKQGDDVMKVTAALVITGLLLSTASVSAGPCSNAIAQFEQAVRQSASSRIAGPTASQTVGAQTGRQPTPDSVQRAQESAQATFEAALARAKSLDEQGDQAGCSQALADAQRMYSFR